MSLLRNYFKENPINGDGNPNHIFIVRYKNSAPIANKLT